MTSKKRKHRNRKIRKIWLEMEVGDSFTGRYFQKRLTNCRIQQSVSDLSYDVLLCSKVSFAKTSSLFLIYCIYLLYKYFGKTLWPARRPTYQERHIYITFFYYIYITYIVFLLFFLNIYQLYCFLLFLNIIYTFAFKHFKMIIIISSRCKYKHQTIV